MEESSQKNGAVDEAVLCALMARSVAYGLLARAFGGEPDEELMALAADPAVGEAIDLLAGDDAETLPWSAALRKAVDDTSLAEAAGQYTRLFVGPASLPSPPWESAQVGTDRLIFQESTLAVREAYRRAGFKAAGYPREPDDHLGTECSFMAALAERTREEVLEGKGEAARDDIAAQRSFLDRHLLGWIALFSARLGDASPTVGAGALYPVLAEVAVRVCRGDRRLLDELEAVMQPASAG